MKLFQLLPAFVVAIMLAVCRAHPQALPQGVPPPNCDEAAPIMSYHVHIVYDCMDAGQVADALALQKLARERWTGLAGKDASCATDPNCRYDNARLAFIIDHPLNTTLQGGPFPSGEWSMFVPVAYIGPVQAWFTQHYYDTNKLFSLLIHTNTGCEYEARHDSAEDFCRLKAPCFTAVDWIFIPAYCFAIP